MKIFRTVLLAIGTLTMTACSSNGTDRMNAGQQMSARGDNIAARGQSWTDGQRDQREGQKIVERSVKQASDGEKDLKKAREAVMKAEHRIETAHSDRTNGERLVSGGVEKMQRAEADYSAIKAGPSAIAPK